MMTKAIFVGFFLMNICTISSTLLLPVICIWIKFKSLSRSSFITLLNAVFNLLILIFCSSETLNGETTPIDKSFLKFGKKSKPAIFKASTKSSSELVLFPSARTRVVSLFSSLLEALVFHRLKHLLTFEWKWTPSLTTFIGLS